LSLPCLQGLEVVPGDASYVDLLLHYLDLFPGLLPGGDAGAVLGPSSHLRHKVEPTAGTVSAGLIEQHPGLPYLEAQGGHLLQDSLDTHQLLLGGLHNVHGLYGLAAGEAHRAEGVGIPLIGEEALGLLYHRHGADLIPAQVLLVESGPQLPDLQQDAIVDYVGQTLLELLQLGHGLGRLALLNQFGRGLDLLIALDAGVQLPGDGEQLLHLLNLARDEDMGADGLGLLVAVARRGPGTVVEPRLEEPLRLLQ